MCISRVPDDVWPAPDAALKSSGTLKQHFAFDLISLRARGLRREGDVNDDMLCILKELDTTES